MYVHKTYATNCGFTRVCWCIRSLCEINVVFTTARLLLFTQSAHCVYEEKFKMHYKKKILKLSIESIQMQESVMLQGARLLPGWNGNIVWEILGPILFIPKEKAFQWLGVCHRSHR